MDSPVHSPLAPAVRRFWGQPPVLPRGHRPFPAAGSGRAPQRETVDAHEEEQEAGIDRFPLLDRDEPRFSEATREMIERGDALVPWFNGVERFDKPPLFYWLQAAGWRLFGESDATARLLHVAMIGFTHPTLIEQCMDDDLPSLATAMAEFCLRALRP